MRHYMPMPPVAAQNFKYMILTKKGCLLIILFYLMYSPFLFLSTAAFVSFLTASLTYMVLYSSFTHLLGELYQSPK